MNKLNANVRYIFQKSKSMIHLFTSLVSASYDNCRNALYGHSCSCQYLLSSILPAISSQQDMVCLVWVMRVPGWVSSRPYIHMTLFFCLLNCRSGAVASVARSLSNQEIKFPCRFCLKVVKKGQDIFTVTSGLTSHPALKFVEMAYLTFLNTGKLYVLCLWL